MFQSRPRTGFSTKNRPSIGPNNNNFNSTNPNFHRTFFIQEKEKGDPYFRKTRVGSCRRVVVRNGIPFALTFKVKNPRGEPMTHYKYTLKQKPKNPTPDSIIKEYMSMKDNSDKQAYIAISAVKNYNNLNLWKELIRLVQISEISENNTNESFNLLNEVADTEERKHREKNFKDRVYDRFNFPKLKPIVFCKVKSSSLSNIEQILNLADSYNNKEDLDKKIVELLDIKDQFRDSEIISKAIKQPYSKDYINNISKAINQAWKDEIYLETAKDARDYYRKMPLEKALKAVQIYHDNLTIFHIGLESTYEEYGKYLYC